MRNLTTILDSVADRLESKGLFKEAREIDVLSNTLEAATSTVRTQPSTYMPTVRHKAPPRPTERVPAEGPVVNQIIMENRDTVATQLDTVQSSLEAIGKLVEQMSSQASKSYPQRASSISSEAQKSRRRLQSLYESVEEGVKQELKNLLISAGGIEEASRYSIDHLRLAHTKG